MKQRTISADHDGQRLDKYLKASFSAAPLSLLFRLLRTKKIKVDGKRAEPGTRLEEGNILTFYLNDTQMEALEKASLEKRDGHIHVVKPTFTVLFEDDDVLVINKPAGVASHSGTGTGHNTVINQVLTYLGFADASTDRAESFKPALIHRLDKDTSGVLLIGKTRKAVVTLGEEMKEQGFQKEYVALVDGHLEKKSGIITNILEKSAKPVRTMQATLDSENGKEATTKYKVTNEYRDASLLRLELLTGRTHQIRTHMQTVGNPILGDSRYGNFQRNREVAKIYGLNRQFLHAVCLRFHHPRTGKLMKIEAPLPDDIAKPLAIFQTRTSSSR